MLGMPRGPAASRNKGADHRYRCPTTPFSGGFQSCLLYRINLELTSSHEMGKFATDQRISRFICKHGFNVPGHRDEIGINEESAMIEVKDDDVPSRPRDTRHFSNRLCWVLQIHENTLSPTYIERRVFESQAMCVSGLEVQRYVQSLGTTLGLLYERI